MLLLEHVLKQVIQETYPDKKIYQDFTIRIVPKELKSKHGQYIVKIPLNPMSYEGEIGHFV